jgi:hypothetical protein
MLEKFGRNYYLLVQLQNGSILTIQPPFTIQFDITRNILTSANVCSVRIYNLSLINRNQIEFNIFNRGENRTIQLIVGYGKTLATIFHGNISQAWSVREGVNFITQIECFDGGFAFNNAQTNFTFPAGTSNQTIIASLVASLNQYNIKTGAIGKYPGSTNRSKTYSGSTTDLLGQLTGGGFFIDNSAANALGNNEVLQGAIPLINSQSGLLGTPVRENNILTFDMILEPRVQAGQIIELQSLTGPQATEQSPKQAINGFYKVTSVKHRGMISEAVCGDAITTLGMFTNPSNTPLTLISSGSA